jgi:DNA-binding NarL/FixJ family response regulator
MLQDYVHKNDISKPVTHGEKVSVIFMNSRERAEKIKQIIASLPEGTMLTARQIDILEGILEGKSRKEMAADLHLSENTVKMHTTSLFKILKVTSREEIIALIKA